MRAGRRCLSALAWAPTPAAQAVPRVEFRAGWSLADLAAQAGVPRSDAGPADPAQPALPDRPLLITGALGAGWRVPPLSSGLWRDWGGRAVPVEAAACGGDYRDRFAPRPGRRFEAGVRVPLAALLANIAAHAPGAAGPTGEPHVHEPGGAGPGPGARLYLAQADAGEALPELAARVPAEPPFAEAAGRVFQRSLWLGPAGTYTPAHRDPYANLLCQAWGAKAVRLYAPGAAAAALRPHAAPVLRNTSQARRRPACPLYQWCRTESVWRTRRAFD